MYIYIYICNIYIYIYIYIYMYIYNIIIKNKITAIICEYIALKKIKQFAELNDF